MPVFIKIVVRNNYNILNKTSLSAQIINCYTVLKNRYKSKDQQVRLASQIEDIKPNIARWPHGLPHL